MNKKQNNKAGFTVVEMIVALAILAFGIVGIWEAFFLLAQPASNQTMFVTADNLAQEGIEVIRNIRNKNVLAGSTWYTGLSSCSGGCEADYKTGTAQEAVGDQLQSYSSRYLGINPDGLYDYQCINNSNCSSASAFQRKITLTLNVGNTEMDVDSLVTWNYNGQIYTAEEKGQLYGWY